MVGIGGALGAVFRWLVGTIVTNHTPVRGFPIATLSINVIGCAVIGLFVSADAQGDPSSHQRLFFVTGVLGGFTTFSAFGLETVTLLRGGHVVEAVLYVALSVLIGIGAVFAGMWLGARP